MYTAFHSLTKKPFSMTADPAFLFVTKQHREALVGLTYAVLDRKGLLVLSGMAGSGKTTLLTWVLQKLACDNLRSSVILNPTLTQGEFLESVMLDFGIADIPASKAQRLWKLQNFLLTGAKEGKVNVLIVDEAHKLSYELLEEIRLLGNLECGDEKLLQILLLGQSELDETLNRPDLSQLKQRISVRLAIGSLAPNEVEHYIQHRWNVAGGDRHPFSAEAVEHILRYSKRIPRLINAICDNALTQAFADESRTVTALHVDAAAEDLLLIDKARRPAVAPAPAVRLSVPAPAAGLAVAANGAAAAMGPSVAVPRAPRPEAPVAAVSPPAAAVPVAVAHPAPPHVNGSHGLDVPVELPANGKSAAARRWALFRWVAKLGWNGKN